MNAPENESKYFNNRISYIGAFLATPLLLIELALFAADFILPGDHLFLEMGAYMIIPPFLLIAAGLIPYGAWRRRQKIKAGAPSEEISIFKVDLSNKRHRNVLYISAAAAFILITMSLIGSFRAYQATETVEFCGTLCHEVMEPEHEAFQNSPHAHVTCAECHIGEGMDWYVKSKLSGVRQIFANMSRSYSRPIHTPVDNLRPAQETCLKCHWPKKFFSSLDFNRKYYLSEEKNPEWKIRMLLDIGGGAEGGGGVHAHMNVKSDIYYVADDQRRQKISWVKSIDTNGNPVVFTTSDSPWKDKQPPAELIRKMDCIDCHNRPSHRFSPPTKLVDHAISQGQIDKSIPYIKQKSVEVLSAEYSNRAQAQAAIAALKDFYKTQYPDFAAANAAKIDAAVAQLSHDYSKNMFPEMKTRWDSHFDNIGHKNYPGCFRCHDDQHKSASGSVISRDCYACHTIVEQGPEGKIKQDIKGLPFEHPSDIGDSWKTMNCSDCHTGSYP